mgnify:CR=1 FL=1
MWTVNDLSWPNQSIGQITQTQKCKAQSPLPNNEAYYSERQYKHGIVGWKELTRPDKLFNHLNWMQYLQSF